MSAMKHAGNDDELIRAAQRGDATAFELLLRRYFGMVHAVAYARLRDRNAAEDLAQEVFLRTHLYLSQLREPSKLVGWLIRVTRNLAADWWRRGQSASRLCRMVSIEEMGGDVPDTKAANAREKMSTQEEKKALHEAISELPVELREIVLLHFAEGVSKEQIAAMLAMHASTVGRRLKKALARMKGSLEPILRESAPSLRATKKAVNRAMVLIGALAGMSAGSKAAMATAAGGTAWFSSVLAPAGGSTAASKVIPFVQRTIQAIANTGIKLMIAKKAIVTTLIAAGLITGGVILHVRNTQRAQKSAQQEDSGPTASEVKDEKPSYPAEAVRQEERAHAESADEATKDADAVAGEGQILEKTGYTIAGQVVDEAGRGVAAAEVFICFDARFRETERAPVVRRLKTDADGRFRARHLPKKRLLITAASKDRCHYMLGPRLSDLAECWCPVTYRPGRDSVTGVRLVLRPGAVIAGTVVDTEGGPVPNAIVTLRPVRDANLEIAVDATGRFRVENLPPGGYSVRAKAERFASVSLWVRADKEDLVVRLPRTCTVEGTVLLADTGEPVAGAEVRPRVVQQVLPYFGLAGEVMGETVETDSDGLFKVSVPPGMDARLSASWQEYYSKTKPTVHVDAEGTAEHVTIELFRGAIVSGTVVDDVTDAPVADVEVSASSGFRYLRTTSDEEGRFTLAGLAEGKNRILAHSAEYDLANPSPEEWALFVEVVNGEDQSGIKLRAAKKPAIAGKVVDEEGEPIFGALVVAKEEEIISGRRSTRRGSRGFSEGDGTFVMRRSHSRSTIMGLLVGHPLYANTYVSVEPDGVTSGTKDVVVVLKKDGASIEGTVRDEQGEPKPLVGVSLMDIETFGTRSPDYVALKSTMTDGDGHYVLAAVSEGTYQVMARFGQDEFMSGPVHVTKGEKVEAVNLVIPTLGGHITGRVTDPDGEPLEGLHVGADSRGGLVRSSWGKSTTTDQEGRYRLTNLEEGVEYSVSVGVDRRKYAGERHRTVTCSADDVDFVLEPLGTGTVSGTVYRKVDGTPVECFYLTIRGDGHSTRSLLTSQDGSFIREDLAVETITIEVQAEGCSLFTSEPFEVVAGEKTVLEIYLEEKKTGTIRGTVCRKSDKGPVEKFGLSLMTPADGSKQSVEPYRGKEYRSADGSFVCEDVEQGTYTIGIVAEGLPDFETEPFEVAADGETVLNIVIGEGGIIRGTVVDGSDNPVAGAVVAVSDSDSQLRFNMSISGSDQGSFQRAHATTGKAGDFELTGVTPGKVTLTVTHPDYAGIKMRDIPVSEDAPTENVTLCIVKGTAVYGWVKDHDGKPRGNVSVHLHGSHSVPPAIVPKTAPGAQDKTPQEVRLHYQASTHTDHQGKYRFERVPGGSYHLSVWGLETRLPRFELEGDEEKEFNVDLSEMGTVAGRLHVLPYSEEVSFGLRLCGKDELAGCDRRLKLDEENAFEVQDVLPGTYAFRVSAYWKEREGGRYNPKVITDPREIIIEVTPAEHVTQDITVTKIEERK